MRGLGNDHVISGPTRGLTKNASDGANRHTDGHGDSMTESTQWGRYSENLALLKPPSVFFLTLLFHASNDV